MNSLSNRIAMIKGLRVECNQNIIFEVLTLPLEGYFFEEHMDPCTTLAQFTLYIDRPLEVDRKQGTRRIYVQGPYNQLPFIS